MSGRTGTQTGDGGGSLGWKMGRGHVRRVEVWKVKVKLGASQGMNVVRECALLFIFLC